MNKPIIQAAITLVGGAAGGFLGYVIFMWLTRNHGALGFAIPGVAVSLGALIGRCPSKWVAVGCGVIGLVAGMFAAWKVLADPPAGRSFSHFVTHFYQLSTLPLVLILLGGLIAFWFPFRRMTRKPAVNARSLSGDE